MSVACDDVHQARLEQRPRGDRRSLAEAAGQGAGVDLHEQSAVDGRAERLQGTVRFVSAEAAFTPYYALTQQDRSRLAYLAEITLDDPAAQALAAGLPIQVLVPAERR